MLLIRTLHIYQGRSCEWREKKNNTLNSTYAHTHTTEVKKNNIFKQNDLPLLKNKTEQSLCVAVVAAAPRHINKHKLHKHSDRQTQNQEQSARRNKDKLQSQNTTHLNLNHHHQNRGAFTKATDMKLTYLHIKYILTHSEQRGKKSAFFFSSSFKYVWKNNNFRRKKKWRFFFTI